MQKNFNSLKTYEISQRYSGISRPILGMFILISMHFLWWFWILPPNYRILTFLNILPNFWPVVCSRLPCGKCTFLLHNPLSIHIDSTLIRTYTISTPIHLKDSSINSLTLCTVLVAMTKSSGFSCCNINHIACNKTSVFKKQNISLF